MEAKSGNLVAARSLFKTAISLEPRNDACWEAWLRMEEGNDLMERASALRLARYESEKSNSVPESFSTMPDAPGPVISTVCSSPVCTPSHIIPVCSMLLTTYKHLAQNAVYRRLSSPVVSSVHA
jgi:hypothetical protein